ncbi:uncharacterized protein YbaA (DUF1428 family) [Angulomicrobium tetraedrale]|uniref:Uncharacterized protein YbaA (DUF1428 family) n=1 Tax=Ancylobacter tetraedralis TaxID=217068 RepID=A0A839Z888_9HYPH|nr:DUF1428 domain-containing protein [Ancylobacter tetraedralis]MBB3770856.1 uncharacterized protein YbaA (DUF1428 family) [Ancylobacter tetraedralis]
MSYIDGFIVAVPTANQEAYRLMAERAAVIFHDHGALRLVECWGDDVPDGDVTDFRRAVQATPEETVVFSWIVWPSRQVRDTGMKAFMDDPRMKEMTDMPFDGQRMIFGGFTPLLDSGAE